VILSNHVFELKDIVKDLDIRDYFVKVNSSTLLGDEKPKWKIFEKAFSELGNVESATTYRRQTALRTFRAPGMRG